MTKTENYNLNQWEAADPVRRGDFNADNAAIDAALRAVSDTAAGNSAALMAVTESVNTVLADLGSGGSNCRIAVGSYTGTGAYGSSAPSSLTLPFVPKVLFIFPTQAAMDANLNFNGMFGIGLVNAGLILNTAQYYSSTALTVLKLSGKTLTWYDTGHAARQFNLAAKYYYAAIG